MKARTLRRPVKDAEEAAAARRYGKPEEQVQLTMTARERFERRDQHDIVEADDGHGTNERAYRQPSMPGWSEPGNEGWPTGRHVPRIGSHGRRDRCR